MDAAFFGQGEQNARKLDQGLLQLSVGRFDVAALEIRDCYRVGEVGELETGQTLAETRNTHFPYFHFYFSNFHLGQVSRWFAFVEHFQKPVVLLSSQGVKVHREYYCQRIPFRVQRQDEFCEFEGRPVAGSRSDGQHVLEQRNVQ